jgi:hypothetical protein
LKEKVISLIGGVVKRELGLSEVIGFLMIVSLLGILFSMYLLYVVPIQGRDAEISHMKYITQEFIGLKADIDGLIINNKINMPIARSFELGTLSSIGSGSLSIMPMSSFIEASGTLMVNEQNDFLTVTIDGSAINLSNLPPIVIPPITNPLYEISCNNKYDCYPSGNPLCISDRCYNFSIKERFSLNNTPGIVTITNPIFASPTPTVPAEGSILNLSNFSAVITYLNLAPRYDLVLETLTNTNPKKYIAEKTIIENVTFGKNYTYNILKDNDIFANTSSDYYLINPDEKLPDDLYEYVTLSTKIGPFSPRIGSLQYESSNRYWVNQDLIYEMGGLFLNQPSDQGSSIMLVPSIAITPVQNISNPGEYILKVSVNNIRITDTEDISGSVSAQIFSKVDKINHNLINATTDIDSNYRSSPTDPISYWKIKQADTLNSHAIWLQYIPDDNRVTSTGGWNDRALVVPDETDRMRQSSELWKRGFDQIKTITNKTISEISIDEDYSSWVYSFRIEGDTASFTPTIPPYSANLIIGQNARRELDYLGHCDPVTYNTYASQCMDDIHNYMSNPGGDPFILDYTESEISLVMQSGAL